MGTRLSSNHCRRSRSATTSPITITTGGSSRRAHAGTDLERDAGAGQGFGLFAAATEDERIAALQPYDPAAAPRVHDQERVDPLLRQRVVAGRLPRVDTPRARGLVEEPRID